MPESEISASDQQFPIRLPLWLAPIADWKFLSIAGLFLLVGLLALNDAQIYNPDSTRYLVWARSLSEFRGFEDLSIPEPLHYVVHAPLYPVLLVPAAVLAPYSIVTAKIFTLLTGVFLLVLAYLLLLKIAGKPLALAGVALLAAHPLTVLFSNQVLSDIPFAGVFLLVALVADRIAVSSEPTPGLDLLLGGLLAAGILLREAGITLFLAALIFFLARGDLRRSLTIGILTAIVYGLWYFRNEVLVAGTEFPPLRNSEIFTLRYFTGQDAPFLAELAARLRVNAEVYLDHVYRLISFSQFSSSPYGVVSVYGFPYSVVMPATPFLIPPLGMLVLGLSLYGTVPVLRRPGSGGLVVAFLPVYLLLIFFYPFNDVRFLYPLVVVMVLFMVAGASDLAQRLKSGFSTSEKLAMAIMVASILPNTLWCYAFVRENMAYRQSPEAVYEKVADQRPFPDLLTKPMGRVGAWLSERHAGELIVMTQWKELALWLPQGKLVELNPLVPLDEFDRFIQDYQVRYVVSAVGLFGIPEFFFQMHMSLHYGFRSEYRTANLEVFSVHPSEAGSGRGIRRSPTGGNSRWERENAMREYFGLAISLLDEGRSDSAVVLLTGLANVTKGGSTILLSLAIANEFAGDFDRAKALLAQLQVMKQSGAFLRHASFHTEIIRILEQAEGEQRPRAKAELLYVASVKYWGLGFHNQSLRLLGRAMEVSPGFAPSLVFGTYYNQELKRWDEARKYYNRLAASVPDHPLVDPLRRTLEYQDSILNSPQPRIEHVLGLAAAYQGAGLGDRAIRALLQRSPSDSTHPGALKMLAELYISKRRYYPALRAINLLHSVSFDPEIARLREEIADRW